MSVEFTVLEDDEVVMVTLVGEASFDDIVDMRASAMRLIADNGIRNYYVDLWRLASLAQGDTLDAFELGDEFALVAFPLDSRTAVRMPRDATARAQVEFMHTVELNRGRGAMRYVESLSEALAWFRSRPPPA